MWSPWTTTVFSPQGAIRCTALLCSSHFQLRGQNSVDISSQRKHFLNLRSESKLFLLPSKFTPTRSSYGLRMWMIVYCSAFLNLFIILLIIPIFAKGFFL